MFSKLHLFGMATLAMLGAVDAVLVYKERTSGECGDSGGGWGKITSAAACGAGASAIAGAAAIAAFKSFSNKPPGCIEQYDGSLFFNSQNPNVDCSSSYKCLCSMDCGAGNYASTSGSCSTCVTIANAATVQCTTGSNEKITTCDAGYYGTPGEATCQTCAAGSITNTGAGTGATTCTPCAAGLYSLSSNVASCQTCSNNSITNTGAGTGATTCTPCAAGLYSLSSNVASCIPICGDGTTLTNNKCEMNSPLVTCGNGTTFNATTNNCEMDSPLVTCGDGTTLTANKCETTCSPAVTCGDGTALTANKCEITSPTDDALAKMCGEGTTFDKAKKKCVTDPTSRCTPGLTNTTTDKSAAADESAGSSRFVSRTATLTATVIIVLFYKL